MVSYDGAVVGLVGFVYLILPSGRATVQAVTEVIGRKLDFLSVNSNFSFVNSVGITADGSYEVAWNILIVSYAVKAKTTSVIFPFLSGTMIDTIRPPKFVTQTSIP